ncbi:hypothetical protein MCUN1_001714 [Malassezia cuniculi]|uniref:Calcineurin-like phosphoesterase domain-containing protein n=1 Tax=Malassezia cuniculi TaxID=948313 RepID=A0AAF0ER30_9BASI|nr:hypothetical protein MCUN1_001714 [Malassezia cuniculi]
MPPSPSLAMLRNWVIAGLTALSALWLYNPTQTYSGRVVVVGDLHGDYEHALAVLRMAGVVANDSLKWSGGKTVLVSTGDIVDRGDDTIALYGLFASLRNESVADGGRVVQIFGNHEIMNLIGDWRYVTKGDVESFGGIAERREAMSKGWIGRDWLEHYNMTARVPLIQGSFSLPTNYTVPAIGLAHGGITPQFAEHGFDAINRRGHSLVSKVIQVGANMTKIKEILTPEESDLYAEDGPLWYRGYAIDGDFKACKNARKTIQKLDVRHLVMGHTPQLNGFLVRCNGQVFVIDTGISRAYGGKQSALVFDTALSIRNGIHKGWQEKSTITALYVGSPPQLISSSTESSDQRGRRTITDAKHAK